MWVISITPRFSIHMLSLILTWFKHSHSVHFTLAKFSSIKVKYRLFIIDSAICKIVDDCFVSALEYIWYNEILEILAF